jgi:IS1 family transposase
MANILPKDMQITAISALVEGTSIRAVERMTGIARNTVMRLAVRVGQTCAKVMDQEMRGLDCKRVQVDEMWGFIGKKQRNVQPGEVSKGDVWTWVAIDADTKLVPSYLVGKRDSAHARAFIDDLASRLNNRVQISSDGLGAYIEAIKQGFGYNVDYGQIVKSFSTDPNDTRGRYSPPVVIKVEKEPIEGNPDPKHISTSYVERQNLTMRMHVRRLTRLTNALSKKLENFEAAIGLHFAYYNFVKSHGTLKCTPAMAAGVTNSFWTVGDLVDMAAE